MHREGIDTQIESNEINECIVQSQNECKDKLCGATRGGRHGVPRAGVAVDLLAGPAQPGQQRGPRGGLASPISLDASFGTRSRAAV